MDNGYFGRNFKQRGALLSLFDKVNFRTVKALLNAMNAKIKKKGL